MSIPPVVYEILAVLNSLLPWAVLFLVIYGVTWLAVDHLVEDEQTRRGLRMKCPRCDGFGRFTRHCAACKAEGTVEAVLVRKRSVVELNIHGKPMWYNDRQPANELPAPVSLWDRVRTAGR